MKNPASAGGPAVPETPSMQVEGIVWVTAVWLGSILWVVRVTCVITW
jgi:hypothetical protein